MFCMNKLIVSILLLIATPLSAIEIADKMYVRERLLSPWHTYDISTDEGDIVTIHRKILSLTKEYHLTNLDEKLLAKATSRFWSLGMLFDVVDAEEIPLGTVEQRLLNLLPTFEIFSPSHEKLAKARLNFWKTKYSVRDPEDNHIIATFSRPLIRFRDKWIIDVQDMDSIQEKNIHPHMFLLLISLQKDIDSEQRSNNHSEYLVYLDRLEGERLELQALEPKEEDYLFISESDPEETLTLLYTEQLTQPQRAALLHILEEATNSTEEAYP